MQWWANPGLKWVSTQEPQILLSEFLRRSLILGFRTIVYIFIIIVSMFRPEPSSSVFVKLWSLHGILYHVVYLIHGFTCSDSVNHNRLQVWSVKCPWCTGYRRRKWTRRPEFKSWTRLIAFHIALIPLGKVWIQLFFLQLWVNSRAD